MWALSKARRHAPQAPSSKATCKIPRSPWINWRMVSFPAGNNRYFKSLHPHEILYRHHTSQILHLSVRERRSQTAATEPFEYTLALPTHPPIIMEASSVLTIARKLVRTIEVTNPRSFALEAAAHSGNRHLRGYSICRPGNWTHHPHWIVVFPPSHPGGVRGKEAAVVEALVTICASKMQVLETHSADSS